MATPSKIGTTTTPAFGSGTSFTFQHTVPATGQNRVLVVACTTWASGAAHTVTATYNGVSMTGIGVRDETVGHNLLTVFVLVNPPTGAAYDVVLTPSASAEFQAAAFALQDVNQSFTNRSGSGTESAGTQSLTWTVSSITAVVGDLIVSFTGSYAGGGAAHPTSAGGGATLDFNVDRNATGSDSLSGSFKTAASGSESVSWSCDAVANYWAASFAFVPASTIAPLAMHQLRQQGIS